MTDDKPQTPITINYYLAATIHHDHDAVMANCPQAKGQIHSIKFHYLGTNGPVYARLFIRKLLGNEDGDTDTCNDLSLLFVCDVFLNLFLLPPSAIVISLQVN
jgi:hypothetical protein